MTTQDLIPRAPLPVTSWPHRRILMIGEGLISLAAAAGTWQLLAAGAPLRTDLPMGLSDAWVPGLWLFMLVAVPAGVAAWLCWRRSGHAPAAVLIASAGLAIDVAVQVPFVGFNVLQLVFGALAVVMALLAVDARRRGWVLTS